MVHLAANGAMVLSSYIPNIEQVFSENEVVYFDSLFDLEEKVTYYLAHEEKRVEVAALGWAAAHERYESKVVTFSMVEKLMR